MTAVDQPTLDYFRDREAIFDLALRERFARDSGDWDALEASYVPDALIRTTWFSGTPAEFVAASRELARAGRHARHMIVPALVRLNGDRALVESLAEIQHREVLDGVEVDLVQYCRFFSRVKRTETGWRLASLDGIYGRDSIAPVNPADELPIDWDALRQLRPSYRVWAYTLGRRGYDVSQELPADDRPDLLAPFYAEAERWLETGQGG